MIRSPSKKESLLLKATTNHSRKKTRTCVIMAAVALPANETLSVNFTPHVVRAICRRPISHRRLISGVKALRTTAGAKTPTRRIISARPVCVIVRATASRALIEAASRPGTPRLVVASDSISITRMSNATSAESKLLTLTGELKRWATSRLYVPVFFENSVYLSYIIRIFALYTTHTIVIGRVRCTHIL